MTYYIRFKFDYENEPPVVWIEGDEGTVLAVFEEPTSPLGRENDNGDWEGEFSWEQEDWQPGPLAKKLVELMNKEKV